MKVYDVIVVGASQAGLAAAYYLQQQKKEFIVLEASDQIGKAWLERYDSLKLFTSARYNNLPGMAFPGGKNHFPTKSEVADYLRGYASAFNLPVLLDHKVTSLSKPGKDFFITTSQDQFTATNVIVCTGPFQTPSIPDFAVTLDQSINQFHSSVYRNPEQLAEGNTLVVGGGNSGVQIVEELVKTKRNVLFSFSSKLKSMPNNRLTQILIFGSGITAASISSLIGKWLKKRPEPIMGTNLKRLFRASNLQNVGRTLGGNGVEVRCEKRTFSDIQNIIWATGFKPDFNWIKLDVFNKAAFPIQKRGVTEIRGLFFLGLAWMHSRNSGLLGGVKSDAAYVTNQLIKS